MTPPTSAARDLRLATLAENGDARIAVLMSVYEGDRLEHVREALQSIFSQDERRFDVFLMLDGVVRPEVDSYLSAIDDPRLKLHRSAQNRGLAASLNELIDHALTGTYEFFARMDCDDVADPSRLRKQVEFLRASRDVAVVGSYCTEIDEDGEPLVLKTLPLEDGALKRQMLARCPFVHSTVVMRRAVFEGSSRYPTDHHLTEDMFLWADLAAMGFKFANLPEPLLRYRVGREFYRRRRGLKKAVSEYRAKRYVAQQLAFPVITSLALALGAFALRLMPEGLLRLCYRHLRPVRAVLGTGPRRLAPAPENEPDGAARAEGPAPVARAVGSTRHR